MNIDALKDKICRINTGSDHDPVSTKQILSPLNEIELFIWLGEQDNSLRYHLALELDIPLQHIEHTCSTLKQIRDQ